MLEKNRTCKQLYLPLLASPFFFLSFVSNKFSTPRDNCDFKHEGLTEIRGSVVRLESLEWKFNFKVIIKYIAGVIFYYHNQ
jgi:hypothetical protein